MSPGTIMQKRLCIMLCSSALCQSVAVPPPCASSFVHLSACDLGSPARREDIYHLPLDASQILQVQASGLWRMIHKAAMQGCLAAAACVITKAETAPGLSEIQALSHAPSNPVCRLQISQPVGMSNGSSKGAPRQQASTSEVFCWRSAPTMAWRIRLATFSQGPQWPRKNTSVLRCAGSGVLSASTPCTRWNSSCEPAYGVTMMFPAQAHTPSGAWGHPCSSSRHLLSYSGQTGSGRAQ